MSTPTTKTKRAGDTMTGPLLFSGVTHAGLKLNNLTTTERDAISLGTGDKGFAIFNTTTGAINIWSGSAWEELPTSTLTGTTSSSTTQLGLGTAGDDDSVAIGENANASDGSGTGLRATAIGNAAGATEAESTSIGGSTEASGIAATAIGAHAIASGQKSVAIGSSNTFADAPKATGANAIAIGELASAGANDIHIKAGTTEIKANNTGWSYTTAASNEGSGARIHNRASQVTGAGTDYSFTNSYARVDFGTTDAEVALPTAGTYLVKAIIALSNGITALDEYRCKLYNSTDAADVANSERANANLAINGKDQLILENVVTVAAGKTIQIYGYNVTAARGSIVSTQTSISYVRLS